MPKKYTKVAIAYDFDGTLAKGNIQENSFIPHLGIKKEDFWKEVQNTAHSNEMDEILAYMFCLVQKAKSGGKVKVDKSSLKNHGKSVQYFDGVEDFFPRINKYAKEKNIELHHYIISSGTKEMIEGTTIAKNFKYIYASSFKYDQHDVPEWPAMAINYTTKTQFLFRINKGIESASDNSKINTYTPESERPIPFEYMIYIGDGLTDVPAMKLVKDQGGTSIGVYCPNTRGKSKVEQLLAEDRVNYVAPARYTENSDIERIVKATVNRIFEKESVGGFSKLNKDKHKPSKTDEASNA